MIYVSGLYFLVDRSAAKKSRDLNFLLHCVCLTSLSYEAASNDILFVFLRADPKVKAKSNPLGDDIDDIGLGNVSHMIRTHHPSCVLIL